MQNILSLESKEYCLKIENFEGPIDLLCYLIDKNKLDICDIKISEIAEQYIEYINEMEKQNLEITSEFLIMAANLIYLKSRKLLPVKTDEEKELTEEELIERIIEYKKYKEITKKLSENYSIFSNRYYNFEEKIELPKQKLEKQYDCEVIPEVYSKLIERNNQKINVNAENIRKIAITDTYTVGSKVKEMFRELIRKPRFIFNKLFPQDKCEKTELVTAFSGLLELSRRSKVITNQEVIFGDIVVEKKKRIEK